MKINFLKILKDSWQITWKNRYLWWFGFFIALSTIGSGSNFFPDNKDGKEDMIATQQVIDFIQQYIHWIILGFFILFILLIIFAILNVLGRGALIDSIGKIIKKEPTNFKLGFREGKKNFWKIFLISFSLGILIFTTVLILATPVIFLFINKNYIIGSFMAFLAFLIFIPLIILANYMKIFGYIYAILGNLNFWPALENAYNLFQKNILSSIIMGLIFIPVNIIVFAFFVLVAIPIALVFLIIGLIVFLVAGKIGAIIVGTIGAIVFLFIILLLRSVYEVFAQSAWILFFHEIAKPKIEETVTQTIPETTPIEKAMPIAEYEKE